MTNRREFIKHSGLGLMGASLIFSFPACKSSPPVIDQPWMLPRSTPEQQGIASKGIRDFLVAANGSGLEFHSLMLLRRGHVVAEGWWAPYAAELKHTLYSLSKSYTSTAVGMLVADGKLSVEDQVIGFFPEEKPASISANLEAMKVKHLLTMTTGHDEGTMGGMRDEPEGNWPKAFLAQEIVHEPGTHFLYNTGATYMLSAIVQRVSGQTLFDFLTERLFKPLKIEGADWEVDPQGVNVGGYGLRVRTEDIAKLGQLYLQKGRWGEEQLLPESWVEEATRKQTDSHEGDSDWSQGYGYQFWRCKPEPGFYRGDGAFGQYCIVIPQYETVIAITSESFDMAETMQLAWKHLLPAIDPEGQAREASGESEKLEEDLKKLSLTVPMTSSSSPKAAEISGKTFQLEENPYGAKSVSFNLNDESCTFVLHNEKGEHRIFCGWNQWLKGKNQRPDHELPFPVQGSVLGRTIVPSQIAASASWKNENTLHLTIRYIEMAHHDNWICSFDENDVQIAFLNSVAAQQKRADERPALKGQWT